MDATSLYLCAERIQELAGVLRARTQLAVALTATLRWDSPGATAFRLRTHEVGAELIGTATALDALADATRRRAAVLAARP